MNPNEPDHTLSDLAIPADAEAPTKMRRKRSPKVAVEAAADAPTQEADAAAVDPVDASVETAKPKRARRKVAPEAAADADAAPVSEPSAAVAEAQETPPPKQRRRTAASAAAAVADVPAAIPVAEPAAAAAQAPAPANAAADADDRAKTPVSAPPEVSPAQADASNGGQRSSAETEDGGEGGAEGEARRRRNRNRRRGRRGGDRLDGAEAEGEFTVVTVAPGLADDDEDGAPAVQAGPPQLPPGVTPLDAATAFADVVSGVYDVEAGETVPEPEKRVLAADPDAPKLHKVLAQAGVGSRRDMEQLIADGKVEVNGQVAHVGQRISFGDRIAVGGRQIKVRIAPLPARVLAYHKPVGEVVTHDDPQHRPTVFRRLPRLPQGKWQSVGRLDINTEGLLLFTNSGELANQLMHPRFGVEREYAVRVLGTLDNEARDKLLLGVEIEGQRASFKSIEDGGGEGVNHWYRVVITEGRNREVRKLFDKVGLGVSRLIRIRYGCMVLPRGLRRGVYVDLNNDEVAELRRLAGKPQGQGGGQARPPRPEGDAAREPRGPRDQRDGGPRGPRDGRQTGPRDNNNGARRDGPPRDNTARDNAPREKRREPRPRDPDSEFAAIPNPLMQTFDKRAIREARQPRRDIPEDGPIPNPLEQTYDKRFVQKPRGLGGAGGGRKGGGGGGGGGQPDPMKTSMGYIGADAFVRKFQGNGGGGGGGGGQRGGGSGGGGGGGGGRRRGGR